MGTTRRTRTCTRRAHWAVAAVMAAGPLVASVVAAPPAGAAGSATVPVPSAAAPPPRQWAAVAKAPGQKETTILFGGTDSHDLGDTWTYDGVWHQYLGRSSPSLRSSASMAYDPDANVTVLFGGIEGGIHSEDDTWVWNGDAWVSQPTPAPAPLGRYGAGLAYDTATGRLVLFGGHRFAAPSLGDMWQWTGVAWVQLTPPTLPPAFSGDFDMMTNPVAPGLVLYDKTSTDTWVWDGTTWTRLDAATAFPLGGAPGATDSVELAAGLLFSGPGLLLDVRSWTASGWSQTHIAAHGPGPRQGVAETLVAYDGTLYRDHGSAERDDTWVLDADEHWQRVTTPFYAVTPRRVLDTRPGDEQMGYRGAKPTAGDVVQFSLESVTLRGGNDFLQLAEGSTAVLQLTATEATADGFVTLSPCGPQPPLASNLNVRAGETATTLAVTGLGTHLTACVYTQSGTHLVADLVGYIPASNGPTATPRRLLDTRPDWQIGYQGAKPAAESIVAVPTGLSTHTVALNVTGADPTADGYVSVVSCDRPALPPGTSSLNLVRGVVRSNVVVATADGDGRVCLYSQSGTHLVVDQLLDLDVLTLRGTASRVLDTRSDFRTYPALTKPSADSTTPVHLEPGAVPTEATALLLQVTATEATNDGYVTAWSCDDADRPLSSVLNVGRGDTRSNLVLVPIGSSRNICLYSQTGTHLVADVVGAL